MDKTTAAALPMPLLEDGWFDPLEAGVRERLRALIEELLEDELTAALGRRYERGRAVRGHRHGRRERQLLGTFGPVTVSVPRARLSDAARRSRE